VDDVGVPHQQQESLRERLQHLGRSVKHVRHGAATDGDAQALEFLLQSVEGNAVRALRGDDVGDEAHAIAGLLLPVRLARRGDDAFTAPAPERLPHVPVGH